jgi:curved DNA-binding protein CbpA
MPPPVRTAPRLPCVAVAAARDPYVVLGVAKDAPEAEIRAAYRRLVQLHHPDHNGGSPESARRFEEVQDAYAEVRRLRSAGGARTASAGSGARASAPRPDSDLDARLADIERKLREANAARERARKAAREAAREAAARSDASRPPRASDDELGYVETDDSFMKILSDARDEIFGMASDARDGVRERRVADRAADALEDIAARLRGERRDPPKERS